MNTFTPLRLVAFLLASWTALAGEQATAEQKKAAPLVAGDLRNTPRAERKVVAVAMLVARTPWGSGTWRTWQNHGHEPDRKDAAGRRDIGSVYYPAIGLYDCSDPDYIDYACQTLAMCHVDAITFYTRDASDEWHIAALRKWVATMPRYGLRGMPRLQPESSVADLDALLRVFAPVALTWGERTVVPFFNLKTDRYGDVARWKAEKTPQPLLLKWISASCRPPFDGGFDWIGDATHPARETSARDGWKRYFDARLAKEGYDSDVERAKKLIASGMSFYAEGVNPGFDDSPVNGWGNGKHYIERAQGETYRYRWQRAVENGYPMVFIPTWDDWGEGSLIEATVEFGNLYLGITREYAAKYKGITPNTGDLSLPQWIYRARKGSTDDNAVRKAMDEASQLLEQRKYTEAEARVRPFADPLKATKARYR